MDTSFRIKDDNRVSKIYGPAVENDFFTVHLGSGPAQPGHYMLMNDVKGGSFNNLRLPVFLREVPRK